MKKQEWPPEERLRTIAAVASETVPLVYTDADAAAAAFSVIAQLASAPASVLNKNIDNIRKSLPQTFPRS